ncbi:MAG TPA: hypothetical protein VFB38_10730 [Chthonomonadaceae bacterium]|nr:hypothetical protein [Chthonomonadaceae bacterium]
MITNPYAGTPAEAGWSMGLAYGYAGPAYSDAPPAVIAPDLVDAFNEGRLVGQQYAAEGIPVSPECMDAREEVPGTVEGVITGGEIVHAVGEMVLKHLARGVAGLVVAFIEASVSLQTHYQAPENALGTLGEQFVEQLAQLGIQDSLEIYCAMGIDYQAEGCQFRFSSLFKSIDQARQAANAMGRSTWVIARWRTDACGSLELVEGNGF